MKIKTALLSSRDLDKFIELIRVFEMVFEMQNFRMPDQKHLQQVLGKNGFYAFAAMSKGNVVGGLTAYTLQQYYSKAPLVYIYDLAVKTEFQRQGIGKKLIADLTAYCQEIGVEEVFVQADEEDGHALDFYRATGATSEKVVHFYYPLNGIN
jgi:aminoglycoside 3-N-acetyltransferase I